MTISATMPILIVDDYPTMLQIIRRLLREAGFENVDAVSSGGEALRKLREREYGLVISDWHMKTMTGLSLLKEIRADERLKELPFIMITAESTPGLVTAAKDAGVSNYIVKPFTAATLRTRIISATAA